VIRLYHGECLEIMAMLPDASVDMILCDLPYGTTACEWDVIIPFDKLWEQYHRLCKKSAAMVFTGCDPFTSKLVMSNREEYREGWIWHKVQGANFLNLKHQPWKVHEDVRAFWREEPTFHPPLYDDPDYNYTTTRTSAHSRSVLQFQPAIPPPPVEKGITYYSRTLSIKSEKGLHPTQKPVALMEYFIHTFTDAGEMVLDNCMGSGTTGVACQNLGRDFIGIESGSEMYATAVARNLGVVALRHVGQSRQRIAEISK
jgi:site-specific DNA-methyltransferase (adenine-specific)